MALARQRRNDAASMKVKVKDSFSAHDNAQVSRAIYLTILYVFNCSFK